MRVCDRCKEQLTVATYINRKMGDEIDLCERCAKEFADWLKGREDPRASQPIKKTKR
jgi:protein-arginine kinase activator protein McsA